MKLFLALCLCLARLALGPGRLGAVPPPPTPGDQVLLIYVDSVFDNLLATNIKNALAALPSPPTVTEVKIPLGNKDGFADNLPGPDPNAYLAQFCQVWDLRFMELNNSAAFSGTIQEDTITTSGANNDDLLYRNFLAQGGHLFIMGENDGFYARNEGVVQFLADATGFPVSYPSASATWSASSIDNSGPELFRTAYDTLTTPLAFATWPGRIALATKGNGTPLSTDGTLTIDLLYQPAQLLAGNGKMLVVFDSNFFKDAEVQSDKYVRNAYTTLSACYNFTITKSVSPATVCAGDPATFTLCYTNAGPRTITAAVVTDTLPACTVFSSSSPPPSGNSGQLYWWNLGNLGPSPQQCITISVVTTSCP